MLGKNLGNEEDFIAPPGDRLPYDRLRRAGPVHLRRVDVRHAKVKSQAQCVHSSPAILFIDVPGPLTDHGHFALRRAKRTIFHRSTSVSGMTLHRVAKNHRKQDGAPAPFRWYPWAQLAKCMTICFLQER